MTLENRISNIRGNLKEAEEAEKAEKARKKRERQELRELEKQHRDGVRDLLQRKIEPYLDKIEELGIIESLRGLRRIEQQQRFKFKDIKPSGDHPASKVNRSIHYKLLTPNKPLGKDYSRNFPFSGPPLISIGDEDYNYDLEELDVVVNSISTSFSWNVVVFVGGGETFRHEPSTAVWNELEIDFTLSRDEQNSWQLMFDGEPVDQLDRAFLEESLAQKFVEMNDRWLPKDLRHI